MSLRDDWKKRAAGELVSIATLIKSAVYIGGILWAGLTLLYWIAEPRLEPILSIPERIERTHDLAQQSVEHIDALDRRVSGVERSIREMRGDDLIADFDDVRSFIDGPCAPGAWCRGEYWVARTPGGMTCSAPLQALPRILNGRGMPHTITEYEVRPVRAGELFERVAFRFMVPDDALPGRAEFFFTLTYDCPGRGEVEQASDPLFFMIEAG